MDIILQSLPKSFKEFTLNYNMNKKIYSLSELMNELVVAEGILGTSSVDAIMFEASTSHPKSKGKGKKLKKKKDFTKQDGKQFALRVANKGKKKGVHQRRVFPLWRERSLEKELSNI